MTTTHYTVSQARNRLGKLIGEAIAGERVVLTHYGVPAIVMVPLATGPGSTGHILECVAPWMEAGTSRQGPESERP